MTTGVASAATVALLGSVLPVPAAQHRPFYPSPDQDTVAVAAFRMDAVPVTNQEFARFVTDMPRWRRGQVPALLADTRYLASWHSPLEPGLDPVAPVTQVSWHAARAYCRAQGGTLPTVSQWELAADATATAAQGGRADPAALERILAWYARGSAPPGPVGQGAPNVHGIHDLHGLIWEWTEDFNSLLIAADTREGGEEDRLRFCGAGAVSAIDPADYASFMRFAFRSSLGANSTTRDLGFRCVYSVD